MIQIKNKDFNKTRLFLIIFQKKIPPLKKVAFYLLKQLNLTLKDKGNEFLLAINYLSKDVLAF